ncbi:hypothetical protein BLNAU_19639 [Blattamonas nauphoetae]|uniref:Zinc finger PHD-type domain-containing protein n=1 Tax=Blattamonas nauphoetae TaxID=2049346 RepID=A0ABQ9X0V5_9EUKA|nr:hypothetical protein BLNAU_19639 [Blattamonas nauphoetae]
MSTLRLLFTRQNRVPERSVEADQVMPLCRFCASSEWRNNGVECVKCGEFCHLSCACEHSLFVALAVHAVNLDDFLCDTCFGEESVSSLAELIFPRSESVVLRHTSLWFCASSPFRPSLQSGPRSLTPSLADWVPQISGSIRGRAKVEWSCPKC